MIPFLSIFLSLFLNLNVTPATTFHPNPKFVISRDHWSRAAENQKLDKFGIQVTNSLVQNTENIEYSPLGFLCKSCGIEEYQMEGFGDNIYLIDLFSLEKLPQKLLKNKHIVEAINLTNVDINLTDEEKQRVLVELFKMADIEVRFTD